MDTRDFISEGLAKPEDHSASGERRATNRHTEAHRHGMGGSDAARARACLASWRDD